MNSKVSNRKTYKWRHKTSCVYMSNIYFKEKRVTSLAAKLLFDEFFALWQIVEIECQNYKVKRMRVVESAEIVSRLNCDCKRTEGEKLAKKT